VAQPSPDPGTVLEGTLRQLDDRELLRLIAQLRQDALGELYDRHGGMLLGLARRILGDVRDAEEVLQEVFLQVWGQAGRFDPDRASPLTWIALITRSRAIDLMRSRGVRQRVVEAVGREVADTHQSAEAVGTVWNSERRERLQGALAELPPEQREVLELAYYGGLTQTEIAEETGLPLGTVKTRVLLAMKKLRANLKDEIEELL
jgi:RNA polymerase sigma-70 factor, ECF subfamily